MGSLVESPKFPNFEGELTRVLYVSSLLITANYVGSFILAGYISHRLSQNVQGWPVQVIVYSPVIIASSFFLEMTAIFLYYYRIGAFNRDCGLDVFQKSSTWTHTLLVGGGSGLFATSIAVPALAVSSPRLDPTDMVASCPACFSTIILLLLYCVAIPVTTELFFRGIVFRALRPRLGRWATILVSTVFFAATWPFFNPLVAAVIGFTTGILYWQTRSVITCIICNTVITISCGAFLLLHSLGVTFR
jgi:membrane protease YdiL (CAAX protease family)